MKRIGFTQKTLKQNPRFDHLRLDFLLKLRAVMRALKEEGIKGDRNCWAWRNATACSICSHKTKSKYEYCFVLKEHSWPSTLIHSIECHGAAPTRRFYDLINEEYENLSKMK